MTDEQPQQPDSPPEQPAQARVDDPPASAADAAREMAQLEQALQALSNQVQGISARRLYLKGWLDHQASNGGSARELALANSPAVVKANRSRGQSRP